MDVVSQLLSAVRLSGSAFLRADMRAPFAVETLSGRATCAAFGHEYEHVIPYHLITRGRCWAGFPGEPRLEATRGTVLLFPRGDAHVLAHDAEGVPVSIREYLPSSLKGPLALALGGNGEVTQLICGFLACESRRWNPLLESLPRMMLVDIADGPVATWMSSSLEYALIQSSASSIGSDAHLARLSELLFVEALRHYLATLPESNGGLLVALQDRHLGPAIARMHADPSTNWRVESLASEAGLSRSAFAERFQKLVGIAPLEYLTRWRMQLAARMLRDTNRTVLSIALDVGYRSDAALIRAFCREFDTTPARWRRSGSRGPQFIQ